MPSPEPEVAASATATTGAPADRSGVRRLPGIAVAAVASFGAGAIHAAAAGIHAEHPQLARLFVLCAAAQLGFGLWAAVRPTRLVAIAISVLNVGAVAAWLATRITGISWIDGLQVAESPQFADTVCAALGAVAAGAAAAAALAGWRPGRSVRLLMPSIAVAALSVPAMISGGTHVHSHEGAAAHTHTAAAADGSGTGAIDESQPHEHDANGNSLPTDTTGTTIDESQPHDHGTTTATATWPRPWDPTQPIDVSGVDGVTPVQEVRAATLIEETLKDLPKYADTAAAIADGYASIGDAGTGSEHYIKPALINDDDLLDAKAPESLVYNVGKDGKRTLAGAMYIASPRPLDDPSLTDYAGPLMQWHVHNNLCWSLDASGKPIVVGLADANGNCVRGVSTGGDTPMVHVWIVPHPCGVFAALEGVGAGNAAVPTDQRVDMCTGAHDHGTGTTATPVPFDPTKPIDLSGTAGVTPEQQAAAENLIAVTLVRLPQWADYHDAEAAGFQSIGDALTGHEHFIQWDWIDDDVILDPDHPESLVYAPQPDGSKKLVSAMYMLPSTVKLADVPNMGGALMQWHIHDNLCFTTGDAPKVAGVTTSTGGCPAGLQKFTPSPMIHVWITSNPCGPFAALEGVGAGQINPGEERLCDHAHGDGLLG